MHRNHPSPKKSLSCSFLKPGRVFREVKCYYVLASVFCFRPEPDKCSLVCQHEVGGRDVIKLVKKETGTSCVLGWFCAACDVQHVPLAC